MRRFLPCAACAAIICLAAGAGAEAQVYVRAPFVRVQVGPPGVSVRAPFVNLYVPSGPAYYVPPPGFPNYPPNLPPGIYQPPIYQPAPSPFVEPAQPRVVPQPQPAVPPKPQPSLPKPQAPLPEEDPAPPANLQPTRVLSLDEFAKSFQPRVGSYEISLMNPVTNEPTTVRFTLPEGQPKRVQVNRREIEFHYGIRHFVRIEFDQDGAIVTSR